MLFFLIALLNLATGAWWLAALMAALGALNLYRALTPAQGARPRS